MENDVLYIEKAKLIESILIEVDDIDIIEKIQSFLRGSVSCPAVMSVEEIRKEVKEATEDVKNGRGIRHEDFMKEMQTWK
jgi:hypothetical protein